MSGVDLRFAFRGSAKPSQAKSAARMGARCTPRLGEDTPSPDMSQLYRAADRTSPPAPVIAQACPATGNLEFEHVDGFALTHLHDEDRIRLMCRGHNQYAQYAAEKIYGRAFMERA